MSRVQLALRVGDLEGSIGFYSKLFGTGPAKRRPGYANFAVAEPALKLVLLEGEPGQATVLDHLGVEVESAEQVGSAAGRLMRRRPRNPDRDRHHLLLRRPGQGVGARAGAGAVGGLRRQGRRGERGAVRGLLLLSGA